jgi:hypothetical protein
MKRYQRPETGHEDSRNCLQHSKVKSFAGSSRGSPEERRKDEVNKNKELESRYN